MRCTKTLTIVPVLLLAVLLTALAVATPETVQAQEEAALRVKIDGFDGAYPGHYVHCSVRMQSFEPDLVLNRVRVLVNMGETFAMFDTVVPGPAIEGVVEYFEYEVEGDSLLLIEAIMDVDSIPGEPEGWPDYFFEESFAQLRFLIPGDSMYYGAFFPLRFYWMHCDENIVEPRNGDTTFISQSVYDWDGDFHLLPDPYGVPGYYGAPDWCVGSTPEGDTVMREIEFRNGGFYTIYADSIDFRGDLNLNSIPNEIADMVLFQYYFLYGLVVFDIDLEAQIAASDVNNDGRVLRFDDIVYLHRIIVGDAIPFPVPPLDPPRATAVFEQNTSTNILSVGVIGYGLAGAYLVFNDSITPTCLQPDPVVFFGHYYDGDTTRVLFMTDIDNEVFSGPIVMLEGPGLLLEAQTADFHLTPISTEIAYTSDEYEIDIDFAVGLLSYIFIGTPLPSPVEYTDADCSGEVDIDDVVWVIAYIFAGGPAPGDC